MIKKSTKKIKILGLCLLFFRQLLLTIKHNPSIFSDTIDSSEWDFTMKFRGVVLEHLFYFSDLRLKWGDTHLTLHNNVQDIFLKVDLRIIKDQEKRKANVENEVGVAESAEESPGEAKFSSDCCKILLESKLVVDRYISNGYSVDNIDPLQICGLEIFLNHLSLEESGLYVGSRIYRGILDSSLNCLERYMPLVIELLCFRNKCIAISNKYENHSASHRSYQKSAQKRSFDELSSDEVNKKQGYIRGSWRSPRTAKTPPPAEPSDLYSE